MTPLKTHWLELYKPITEHLKLDMRMNLKTKKVGVQWMRCRFECQW
jgi:RNA-binding protein PNO1